jgi:hypothetical protein
MFGGKVLYQTKLDERCPVAEKGSYWKGSIHDSEHSSLISEKEAI